jgi:CheY-like chemotaxis protein
MKMPSNPVQPGPANRRALVVDDSMLIRHTVCRFLEEHGFEVESATNGADALQILVRFTPNIVFTDLDMPKLNGHQLIDALKARLDTLDIPIVVLSARRSADESRATFCMNKDADIYAELLRVLDATVGRAPSPVNVAP